MAVSKRHYDYALAYLLCYIATFISGFAVYLTLAQKDKKLRFHAVQSMLLGSVIFVLWLLAHLPFLSVFNLIAIMLWLAGIYVGWEAAHGRDVDMPFIKGYAEEYSG
ncbi:MAG: hypothetical protein KGH69_01305 [Candidatus Micrarchaeota archaeon]|nr:hypothetical protein [Candidatus Micrarchaeota archaeon]